MGLYFPRWAVILTVYFDDFKKARGAAAGAISGAALREEQKSFVIRLDGSPGSASAPRSATAHLNSYAKADTFEIECLARSFPISPELIRAVGVELYMFQTKSLERDIAQYLIEENLLVAGLADEGEIDDDVVRLTGRDYTALMLDKTWPPSKAIPIGRDIDQVIQDLVDEAAQAKVTGRILTVKFASEDARSEAKEQDTTSNDRRAGISRKSQMSKKKKKKKPTSGEHSTITNKKGLPQKGGSYWDVIQKLALRHGLICYVHGTSVILDDPKGLTVRSYDEAPHLVHGKNLKDIRASRKFSRAALPQFVCYVYDDKERKQVVGKWPPDQPQRPNGMGAQLDTSEIIAAPPGIRSADAANDYCRAYYEARSRAEGKLHFSTRALRDLDGKDSIQRLRPGRPTRIEWDHVQGSGELRRMSQQQRAGRLLELGYSRDVAQMVAEGYERLEQINDRPLYVRELTVAASKDDGITIDCEAVNYVVEVRDDA